MLDANLDLMGHIFNQTPYLVVWVSWLMAVNTMSVLFVARHVEARWVLGAWLVNLPLMTVLFDSVGFVRLLGLSHIVVWTPLLIYLWTRRAECDLKTGFGKWAMALFLSNGLSLAIDYVDIVRYMMGDGSLPQ